MSSLQDLTGERFGKLRVLERDGSRGSHPLWLCECDCGKNAWVRGQMLREGRTQSCGCLRGQQFVEHHFAPGDVYHGVTLLRPMGIKRNGSPLWECECGCGNTFISRVHGVRIGNSTSCGCKARHWRKGRALPHGESAFNNLFRKYNHAAESRDLCFGIDKELFRLLVVQPCHYCGAPPSNIQKSTCNTGDFVYTGLDRVDSSLGYTEDNVVPCCAQCNLAKKTMSVGAFLDWIDRVYHHQHSGVAPCP